MITKKKRQKKNPLEDVQNQTPPKKKTVFSTQNPLAEIYIYTVDLSQSMEKKFTLLTPPPVHFPKITFTSCPTSLPKPRRKTILASLHSRSSQIARTLETSISKLNLVQGVNRMEREK